MQQEARNTEGRNIWRMGTNFRHQAVQFVSAGLQENDERNKESLDMQRKEIAMTPSKLPPEQPNGESMRYPHPTIIAPDGEIATDTEHIDHIATRGDNTSEDEIVFTGRRLKTKYARGDRNRSPISSPSTQHNAGSFARRKEHENPDYRRGHESSPQIHGSTQPWLPHHSHRIPTQSCPTTENALGDLLHATESTLPERIERKQPRATDETFDFIPFKSRRASIREQYSRLLDDEENDILADYIANIDDDYGDYCQWTELCRSTSTESDNGQMDRSANTLVSAELANANCCGPPNNGEGILPCERGQMLAECEDESDPDLSSGGMPSQLHPNTYLMLKPPGFTAKSNGFAVLCTSLTDKHSSTSSSECSDNETKGIGKHSEIETESSCRSRPHRNRSKAKGNHFASATAFADALESDPFYGFDIMDFNRPSLRNKRKGKQRAFDMSLSDSELELQLERAWRNDREKKKTRKQKREELRAGGLLVRNANAPDLRAKYSSGFDVDDLRSEMRSFLLSSKERKVVHDMAGALSLKSQSRGKGSSRFPMLYKTSRTPKHTQKTIAQVEKLLSKSQFSHRGPKARSQNNKKLAKASGGRPTSSVSYMEGDVVGASAPEIGAENKGRAMLERMGWSLGTPLGAINNKGILLPVAHVVKNSKAGLG
ncbi:putative R3H and G-patch domain protein [Aspergillus fischeri NRRL 181]|uniref:R3H and G-patch domain protein, putative n=1 Tax=Neosartorya fischeri (strain ATCC 1020 / DSM 3700 / CBS 544.65 / FGSC A1164 / JCM 1740 / NRRL 181 / WB 181) TaxID=331117 RepID=A1D8H1_NEOFI|nr:R3H and G-patch domain protein, putative [Aspergillus fischeri NRRL 181]EAW22015.1 R3H and G-patch domain protein, putative [Aspergillus fischeri NRRL 181]